MSVEYPVSRKINHHSTLNPNWLKVLFESKGVIGMQKGGMNIDQRDTLLKFQLILKSKILKRKQTMMTHHCCKEKKKTRQIFYILFGFITLDCLFNWANVNRPGISSMPFEKDTV